MGLGAVYSPVNTAQNEAGERPRYVFLSQKAILIPWMNPAGPQRKT